MERLTNIGVARRASIRNRISVPMRNDNIKLKGLQRLISTTYQSPGQLFLSERSPVVGQKRPFLRTPFSSLSPRAPFIRKPDRLDQHQFRGWSSSLLSASSDGANTRVINDNKVHDRKSDSIPASDNNKRTNSSINSAWKQTTLKLLDEIKIGQFSSHNWYESYMAICNWIKINGADSTRSHGLGDKYDSVEYSLRLLDRMYQEEEEEAKQGRIEISVEIKENGVHHDVARKDYNTDLLNLVVNEWRKWIIAKAKSDFITTKEVSTTNNHGHFSADGSSDDASSILLSSSSPSWSFTPSSMLEVVHKYHKNSTRLRPNVKTYSMIIDALSSETQAEYRRSRNSIKSKEGAILAESILDWMIEESVPNEVEGNDGCLYHKTYHVLPNTYTFSSVMNSWVNSDVKDAPQRVEQVFDKFHSLRRREEERRRALLLKSGEINSNGDDENDDDGKHITEDDFPLHPNDVMFSTIINAYAKIGNVTRVEELMSDMYEEYKETGNLSVKPTLYIFNGYLAALANNGRSDQAEAVLRKMENLFESGELDFPPDVVSYGAVLNSYAKSTPVRKKALRHRLPGEGDNDSPEHAERILREMECKEGIEPNAIAYNTVMDAYAKAGNTAKAEAILQRMYENYVRTGNTELRPSVHVFNSILVSLSQRPSYDSGIRGEKIINLMEDLFQSGELESRPSLISYNCVLNCWAKSTSKDGPQRAQAFLDRMINTDRIQPDLYSYNIVLHALCRNHHQQQQRQKLGTHPKQLDKARELVQRMVKNGVRPDAITYNTLLAAWSRSDRPDAADRAIKLFAQMKQDKFVSLTLETLNTVLHCYGDRGENPERAEQLLGDMCSGLYPDIHPDRTSYNTVIAAWAKSCRHDAAQRAERILHRMTELGGESVQPDVISFNCVINAYARSSYRKDSPSGTGNDAAAAAARGPERCEEIVRHMRDLYEQTGNSSVKPDVVTYNSLMSAWAQSGHPEAPERAEAILQDMERSYDESGDRSIRPNGRCYRTLLKAWSRSGRPDAGRRAEACLDKMIAMWMSGNFEAKLKALDFDFAILAWTSSGDPEAMSNVERILDKMMVQVQDGNKHAIPDHKFFRSILMNLSSRSMDDGNTMRAVEKVADMMRQCGVKPDLPTEQWLTKTLGRSMSIG